MDTTPQSYFMGNDGFVWFIGVVEDKNDPSQLGRVRVRCLGFHPQSLTELPTADLPWAYVMHPVTDAAMQGMGTTPSFIAEGAWVVGFFRDAQMKQQPIIMGSLPGIPQKPADPKKGFNDPRSPKSPQKPYAKEPPYGPYPVDDDKYTVPSGHGLKEPDTNRLARGKVSETHNKLKERRANRLRGDPEGAPAVPLESAELGLGIGGEDEDVGTDPGSDNTGVPIATKPHLKEVSTKAQKETRTWWNEPHPKGHKADADPYPSGLYPWNHVFESESGHIMEIDDSPPGPRLFRQHPTGTFEEIHPDGTKVVKVVGDNYEIIMGKTNVFMVGDVNITVKGNVRELIKGDYILEVEGDYWNKIHGNMKTKIGAGEKRGNKEEEIRGDFSHTIESDVKSTILGNLNTEVQGWVAWDVWSKNPANKAGWGLTTKKGYSVTCNEESIHYRAPKQHIMISASEDVQIHANKKLYLRSTDDMVIHTVKDMKFFVSGDHLSTTAGKWTDTASGERFIKGSKVKINDPGHPGNTAIF